MTGESSKAGGEHVSGGYVDANGGYVDANIGRWRLKKGAGCKNYIAHGT